MRTHILLACVSSIAFIGCHADGRGCGCRNTGCAQQQVAIEPARKACVSPPTTPCVPEKPSKPVAPIVPDTATTQPAPAKLPKQVNWVPPKSNFGNASDFSWLIGQLRRVHVTGGTWKIRYKPIDQQDKWGGSVILSDDARVDKFKDGDYVFVRGEIIARRPTIYLAGPLYRVSTIRLLTEDDAKLLWTKRLQRSAIKK